MKIPNEKVWLARAGTHSHEKVPIDRQQRLFFALIEAIDYQCWQYGDCPSRPTETEAKKFLIKHKKEIKAGFITSYVGLFAGVLDFLKDKEACLIGNLKVPVASNTRSVQCKKEKSA